MSDNIVLDEIEQGEVFIDGDVVYIGIPVEKMDSVQLYVAKHKGKLELIGDSDAGVPSDTPEAVQAWLWRD